MKPLSDKALDRLRAAASLPDLSGTRYTILRELGRGGMGVVYLAKDTELDREVALKVLHLDDVSPELATRMRREARTLAKLEHPNIVPIYDFGELPGGRLFYVMKCVQGTRLDEYIRHPHDLPDRLRLFEKICEAAAFAHSRGIIHRDLKPENIMVGSFGEVLIMDWGLVRILTEGEEEPRIMGTLEYMAPEQARGDQTIDHRADIYALGRILEVLTGGHDAPKPIQSICFKAKAHDPAARYDSAAALATDILRFLDGQPTQAHKETPVEALIRFYSHNRTLVLLLLTYVVMRFSVFLAMRR